MTEEDTFNALRRVPALEVFPQVRFLMGNLLEADRSLDMVTTGHPKVKAYMNSMGWENGKDLQTEYERAIGIESKKYRFE